MRMTVKLTLDGLIRALRLKAHGLADTATARRPERAGKPPARPAPARPEKTHG